MEKWKSPSEYAGFDPVGDYVLYARTRDSALITNCNWDELVKAMEPGKAECINAKRYPDTEDVIVPAVYTFSAGHWACGWVEYLMVRAEASQDVIDKAQALEDALEGYPILNDSAYYEKVSEASQEYWDSMSMAEKVSTWVEHKDSETSLFAVRRGYDADQCVQEYIERCVSE